MMAIPNSMYRLVKETEQPSYVYKEVPVPSPVGDELLVKVGKVALCGTDISLYQWNSGEESSCFLVSLLDLHCFEELVPFVLM